jgi:hypothetical protein
MPLSDDQKAMLRLLAQSDVGYEDIAALKGKSVAEIKAEVEAALAELDRSQPEPPPPSPPEPEPIPPPPAAPELEKRAPAVAPPSPAPKRAPRLPRAPMPAERRRLFALMAVVLGAIALISGGGEDSGSDSSAGTANELAAVENDSRVTRAVLEPADGGDATGVALFGRLGKEEVVLQVAAEGLDPTADGESYTVWLYRSPKVALRVGSVRVGDGEELAARFPIPTELLTYIAGGAFDQIYVSRTSDATYEREVEEAKEQKRLPSYSGETMLSGQIVGPLAEAAAKQGR